MKIKDNKMVKKAEEIIKKIKANETYKKISYKILKLKNLIEKAYKKHKTKLITALISITYIYIYYKLILLMYISITSMWYAGISFFNVILLIFYFILAIISSIIKFDSPHKLILILLIIETLV